MISYTNSILATTALVTSAAENFYDRFSIQSPSQLLVYAIAGITLGAIPAFLSRENGDSGLEIMEEIEI